jgi:hypothetical protein
MRLVLIAAAVSVSSLALAPVAVAAEDSCAVRKMVKTKDGVDIYFAQQSLVYTPAGSRTNQASIDRGLVESRQKKTGILLKTSDHFSLLVGDSVVSSREGEYACVIKIAAAGAGVEAVETLQKFDHQKVTSKTTRRIPVH